MALHGAGSQAAERAGGAARGEAALGEARRLQGLTMPPTPFIKSFLIADSVIQDRLTGKWSVVGIFEQIFAPAFPTIHPVVSIYVKLSDAVGRYRVRIEFRDAEDKVISAFKGLEIEVQDRLRGGEFGVTTYGLPLEKPGRYQFSLYLNDEFAASAPLEIVQLKPQPPASPAP